IRAGHVTGVQTCALPICEGMARLLNAVVGYAHLLSSGALTPEKTSHALAAIQRNASAQSRLIESLLDLSRVMAGKLELNLEQVRSEERRVGKESRGRGSG